MVQLALSVAAFLFLAWVFLYVGALLLLAASKAFEWVSEGWGRFWAKFK